MNNFLALVITFAVALAFLRLMDFLAHRGWIESRLSRKIIHIGTGPIFVLCWLLFKDSWDARWLAALVPLAITAQFALVGLGVIKDEAAVQAMSRTGDRREILRGPLYYGIVFVLLTLVFWKDSPVGIVALMLMCGGDGIADLVGRRVASPKLPWSSRKICGRIPGGPAGRLAGVSPDPGGVYPRGNLGGTLVRLPAPAGAGRPGRDGGRVAAVQGHR